MKKLIGTIDLTPTWEGVLPGLLATFNNSPVEKTNFAESQLQRMAQVADKYVADQKGFPIASAPDDGTQFLVWLPDHKRFEVISYDKSHDLFWTGGEDDALETRMVFVAEQLAESRCWPLPPSPEPVDTEAST